MSWPERRATSLRGLETHRFPPAGRLKTTGSGPKHQSQFVRSSGEGQPTALRSDEQPRVVSTSTGVQSTHRTPGPRKAQMPPRGRGRSEMRGIVFGRGPFRVQLGAGLSRAPRAHSVLADRAQYRHPLGIDREADLFGRGVDFRGYEIGSGRSREPSAADRRRWGRAPWRSA
jgi:hypothetical protein